MKEFKDLFDDLNWEEANRYAEGTKQKVLRDDDSAKTILLKLPKGFYMARHSHVTTEQHFVLEGEYISEDKTYQAGSYQLFNAHEEHGPFESKDGALILVVWDPYKLVK